MAASLCRRVQAVIIIAQGTVSGFERYLSFSVVVHTRRNHLSEALLEEGWELPVEAEILKLFLEAVPECWVEVSNLETTYTWITKHPLVLLQGSELSFPELGLTVDLSFASTVHLSRHPEHEAVSRLSLVSLDRTEQWSVSVGDLCGKALEQLAENVVRVVAVNDLPRGVEGKCRKLCSCCDERRKKFRAQASGHPLYHLLCFSCLQMDPLRVDMKRKMCSYTTSFVPGRHELEGGRILLGSGAGMLSVDLPEVFHAVAKMAKVEEVRSTVLDTYNSFGERLLTLSQAGDSLFELWTTMAKRAEEDE